MIDLGSIAYPIKFDPILKEKIWGGSALVGKLNKNSSKPNIGESWELSCVEGNVSVVSNGLLKGLNLNELILQFKSDLLGRKIFKRFGEDFPLLFKFIDAKENLSIQLHPNDELASKRHNSFGKTEMWYVLDAEKKSKLYAGLNKRINKAEYSDLFRRGELQDLIHIDTVKKGDSFFIEVGTIHAIGAGIVLAEIQQTSDVTYRLYDWDRQDSQGNSRELHNDLAIDAIDFNKVGSCKLDYEIKKNATNNIYDCKYFTTNKLFISKEIKRNYLNLDSFIVYMCVEGKGIVCVNDTNEIIRKGETILIPSCIKEVDLIPTYDFELLEVYVK